MDIQKEKLELVDVQLVVSGVIVGAIILSVFIGYNARKKLTTEDPYWSDDEVKTIAIAIKVIILVAAIINIFLNNKSIDVLKAENADKKDIDSGYLELVAGWLILIGAILVLIATINISEEDEFLEIENPEV